MNIDLYPGKKWIAAELIERENRFVMSLLYKGEMIKAHVPNTGRMEEFLYPGAVFFLIPSGGKYAWRVIGTEYDGFPVLLDTIKVNGVVEILLKEGVLGTINTLKREVNAGTSRFDFQIDSEKYGKYLEVKSCTLCHRGVAMFPDAPTERGLRHINELDELKSSCFFLTTHYGAGVFMPNHHTDYDYSLALSRLQDLKVVAGKLKMADPVTMDTSSFNFLKVDLETAERDCADRGTYMLVMEVVEEFSAETGALGTVNYKKGFYIYTGSAMKNLKARVKRHQRKRKKKHWHMDYILPSHMKVVRSYMIRREDHLEEQIGSDLLSIADDCIDGFGSTDSSLRSHLTYFKEKPIFKKEFQHILLNYRMYIK